MTNENCVLRAEGVSYTYGNGTPFCKKALRNVSLEIERGSVTGIIGHTGCGKSTLVQQLNGLLRPDAGTICLNGENIWKNPGKIRDVHFRVGLVFQYPEYQLFEETVEKDIAFGPKNMGLRNEDIAARVRDSLHFVGLEEDILSRSPFELSGGQKRRVAIAGVIAMEPEVLILDEPAAGLDPVGRAEIFGGLRAYREQTGKTVVIVSHSMEDMAKYADRIVVMNRGEILMEGECRAVFKNTALLQSVGLNIPQVTQVLQSMRQAGLPVRDDLFTVEEAANELLSLWKGGVSLA